MPRLSPAASHLPLSPSPPPPPLRVIPTRSDAALEHLAAVSQREWGCGRGRRGAVLADCWQTSHRGPITFSACQEGVNPRRRRGGVRRGGGQTLGSMVTECVINAAMCPVPRTFSTSGPFLRLWKRGRGQQEERGASGPPLCHCICPERGYSLRQGLRRMTLVSHEVMGDNRLVSDDGCAEGEGISKSHELHRANPITFAVWWKRLLIASQLYN